MKVLDLQCDRQHTFEGWFGSEDDFQGQLKRGLVACPLCASLKISKKLSAPRLNLGRAPENSSKTNSNIANNYKGQNTTHANPTDQTSGDKSAYRQTLQENKSIAQEQIQANRENSKLSGTASEEMQAAWLDMAKQVVANTEDVGNSFASEARKIHYGEADERAIRGQVTPDQTMELIEEGIDVLPLHLPESLKKPLN